MAKKIKEELADGVIATIYDFPLKLNTLYEVTEKLDSNAPDGFIEYNTTKTLSAPIVDSLNAAVYNVQRKIWDTGLYLTSNSFREAFGGLGEDGMKIVLDKIQEYIVKPFEAEKGEGYLDYTDTKDNNERWDNFSIKLNRGKIFDTSKIDDLLQLYFCLIHRRLTPKQHESNPLFKQPVSNYLVVDKEGSTTVKAQKAKQRMKAIASFMNLQEQSKETLVSILDYLGIQASVNTDDDALINLFERYLDDKQDKHQNAKLYLDAVSYAATDEGKEVLYIHKKLKEMYRKNNSKVRFKRGEIHLDDVYVENGWKNAAVKIHKDQELKELFANIDS